MADPATLSVWAAMAALRSDVRRGRANSIAMEHLLIAVARVMHGVMHPRWRLAFLGVAGAIVLSWFRSAVQRWAAVRALARRRNLCLSSSLEGSSVRQAAPFRTRWRRGWLGWIAEPPDRWRGACPSCKRPIEAQLWEPWEPDPPEREAIGRFAYVITLWGSSADYILGALVLGESLRRTQSRHFRVCLHTGDVPADLINLLSELWECRLVEHIDACTDKLSFQDSVPHRFDHVFTKLRAMQLTEFEKVLMMDIDLIVTSNIDHLFNLKAPAALRRGMNDSRWPLRTGDFIDGRAFFGGADVGSKWSWGQGTGINAGVMLLQPNANVFQDMLREISEPAHPSHVRGNGPEQDYLSRYWADAPWTNIGVEYNYQLHQMFFALHPKWARSSDRATLLTKPGAIKVVHFSGVPDAKPWHRVLDPKWADFWPDRSRDAEYTTLFADEFLGHWLWIRKDRATWESVPSHQQRSEMQDLQLGPDGEIYQKSWDADGEQKRVEVPPAVAQGAMAFLSSALSLWFDCFQDLEQTLGARLERALAPRRLAVHTGAPGTPRLPQEGRSSGGTGSPGDRSDAVARQRTAQVGTAGESGQSEAAFQWKRHNSWLVEQPQDPMHKLTVACGAMEGRPFVYFCECGVETYSERDDPELVGIIAKVAGPHCARHFQMPSVGAGSGEPSRTEDELQEALAPVHLWVDSVPFGAAVMVAVVGLDTRSLAPALEALSLVGVPQGLPPEACTAIAALGVRRNPAVTERTGFSPGFFGDRRSNASHRPRPNTGHAWQACHASSDIAYATMPFRI